MRAQREHKFVLMDLEAVWCHWCHVEDEVTYRDPAVIALINARYIPVKVDQDSRPDISSRYEDYGWPATIVFNDHGGEIVKRQGYIPPKPMASMLQAIIDDPSPGPSVRPTSNFTFSAASVLAPAQQDALLARWNKAYDAGLGGWGDLHKFIDGDSLELSLSEARRGDADALKKARTTLTNGLKLIDPVWGGVYQYSVDGDWDHPHFEKLIQFQAQVMRVYALAFAQLHDPAYLKASQEIHRYLNAFLRSPDGAYYVSQDADLHDGDYAEAYFALGDAQRRREGVPRVDRHEYARENGWAISGLVGLYQWGGDVAALDDAKRAAQWTLAHRGRDDGGFNHGDAGANGPYFADTLDMVQALMDLYAATGERAYLTRAQSGAIFIAKTFGTADMAGFLPVAQSPGRNYQPVPDIDENVRAVRTLNLLAAYTGDKQDHAMAQRAMRFLATPQIMDSRGFFVAGILLANQEIAGEPLHVTIVGPRSDAGAAALFARAFAAPTAYRRIEWWDRATGPLPNSDVDYPMLKTSAAFVCTSNACSSPIGKPEALAEKLKNAR